MKKFSFRLERVLQLRVMAEQERAAALAEARAAEAAARADAEGCAAMFAEAVEQVAAMRTAVSQAGTLGNLHLPLEAAAARASAAAARHRETQAALEAVRVGWEEARQARMAIEKLRDQRRAQWEQDVAKYEQAGLDEIAIRMAFANGGATGDAGDDEAVG